jgi:hypothetical protein
MSLRGTLGDFGIADIFQLIGHQAKTGVLLLKDRELEVRIFFVEGSVVKAEQSSRDKADLLGNIMVRARALSQAQLEAALVQQQRTLRRLGDILVEMQAVDRATLKDFARLQTTETIYRLFGWKAGTYEFVAEPVDYDEASYDAIRSENILMEGFRMVDEWPAVRKVIPSTSLTFRVLRDLPAPDEVADRDDDLLAGLDDALSGDDDDDNAPPPPRSIGPAERAVFVLVVPGRTVAEMVDLSRMGEFETCKALASLVGNNILAIVAAEATATHAAEAARRAVITEVHVFAVRMAVFAAIAVAVGALAFATTRLDGALLQRAPLATPTSALLEAQGQVALSRLRQALEIHRCERGHYPQQLQDLADQGLVMARDLEFPFTSPYNYQVNADGTYALALPVR